MSEVQSRPARGRSSARGGRGGFGSRGSRKTNGDGALSNIDTTAEQGELGELKKQYQSQLSTLKELFPDWTDADLVLALDESGGDLETTIEKISEGAVSQFSEVPKKAKDRSRSKAAKDTPVVSDTTSGARVSRGEGPRRGGDGVRGGRGRGTDRGRGGLRGGRGGASTGPRAATGSVPTTESPAWGAPAASEESKDVPKENGQSTETSLPHVPDVIEKPVVKVAAAAKKTWASMFAKPAPPPAVPKPAAKPAPAADQSTSAPTDLPVHETTHDPTAHAEEAPQPPVADETTQEPSIATEDTSKITPDKIDQGATPELTLTPSKDKLTEENVEHLPDESHPPPTETAFSTVASSKDIGSAVATPLNGPTQAPIGRPAVGGYATTALKATSATPQRSASFQKRLKEQQEAVVMPGNHAVDRAAVQFGSLGLGDGADLDVDEDREEAETRTQPPQHSPVAQPRAALPPVHRQQAPQEAQQQEALPTPKQAPGLPPVPQQQNIPQQSPSNPLAAQAMQNQGSNQSYNQFGRYGQGIQNEPSAPPQKPYDPFGQQIPQSNQYDYPGQQSQAPSQPGAFSSAPDSFASQYLTSEQRSQQYQNYYGNYGQQQGQSQQDAGSAQQRTGSGFGSGPDSTFGQTQQQGQSQSRYTDAQNSGHNTPNPAASAQQGPGSQSQHLHGQQQGHAGGYPYNHPYYGSPYYANYMNQFGGYGQGGAYGSFGKGMYGQPHHYGMSPQAAFEQHSSSPANAGGFGASSLHERGSGFGDYGRSASAASQNPTATAGSSGFGSIPESFSRPQGYSNQSSYGQQQAGQQGLGDESLKPFGDSKSGGPSPAALGAQPGRPGSATQSTPSQSAQGSLPQHSQQQGFGQYPGHVGGNNQYGGLGGLGHQNSAGHQQSGYGNYGGFGGYGGGSYNRGGWGGNYGQH